MVRAKYPTRSRGGSAAMQVSYPPTRDPNEQSEPDKEHCCCNPFGDGRRRRLKRVLWFDSKDEDDVAKHDCDVHKQPPPERRNPFRRRFRRCIGNDTFIAHFVPSRSRLSLKRTDFHRQRRRRWPSARQRRVIGAGASGSLAAKFARPVASLFYCCNRFWAEESPASAAFLYQIIAWSRSAGTPWPYS